MKLWWKRFNLQYRAEPTHSNEFFKRISIITWSKQTSFKYTDKTNDQSINAIKTAKVADIAKDSTKLLHENISWIFGFIDNGESN